MPPRASSARNKLVSFVYCTVAFLQSRCASLITPDDKGLTPLHAACWMGRDEVARFLLEKGVAVQPHTTDASRDTAR